MILTLNSHFFLQASDGAWQLDTVVSIVVQDDNDNAPKFDR